MSECHKPLFITAVVPGNIKKKSEKITDSISFRLKIHIKEQIIPDVHSPLELRGFCFIWQILRLPVITALLQMRIELRLWFKFNYPSFPSTAKTFS